MRKKFGKTRFFVWCFDPISSLLPTVHHMVFTKFQITNFQSEFFRINQEEEEKKIFVNTFFGIGNSGNYLVNILHIFKIGSGANLHSEKLQNRNPHFDLGAISISKLGKILVIVNCKGVYKYQIYNVSRVFI